MKNRILPKHLFNGAFIISMLLPILLLHCDKSTNVNNQEKIESQSGILGIWKPIKAELHRKGLDTIDSITDYSRYDCFYEFSADSFHYIEPAIDTACYKRTAVVSRIQNGVLIIEDLEQKIEKVNDTLSITWTNDSLFDAVVFLIELEGDLAMGLCPKTRQDAETPIDDLPTHPQP